VPIPYEPLREIVRQAGVDATTDETTALRRLQPYRGAIVSWLYAEFVAACRARHVVPVFAFLPQPYPGVWEREVDETLRLASEAGFVVLDLRDAFKGSDLAALHLADWDTHPNARGHQLMAAALYDALVDQAQAIFKHREVGR
jgi:hypothetical protein